MPTVGADTIRQRCPGAPEPLRDSSSATAVRQLMLLGGTPGRRITPPKDLRPGHSQSGGGPTRSDCHAQPRGHRALTRYTVFPCAHAAKPPDPGIRTHGDVTRNDTPTGVLVRAQSSYTRSPVRAGAACPHNGPRALFHVKRHADTHHVRLRASPSPGLHTRDPKRWGPPEAHLSAGNAPIGFRFT
jgi:hypothetical protein